MCRNISRQSSEDESLLSDGEGDDGRPRAGIELEYDDEPMPLSFDPPASWRRHHALNHSGHHSHVGSFSEALVADVETGDMVSLHELQERLRECSLSYGVSEVWCFVRRNSDCCCRF